MNTKASGKAALHCASVSGDIPVMKAILEFNPDLEIEVHVCTQTWTGHLNHGFGHYHLQDEDGDRPLHLCAYRYVCDTNYTI